MSRTASTTWINPPAVVCGTPEVAPQLPSPGTTNSWVGSDASFDFAVALPPGGSCGAPGLLGRHARLEIDTGTGFHALDPLGASATGPSPGHRYWYRVQGHNAPVRVRWVQPTNSNNYGKFSLLIEEANPNDVQETLGPGARPLAKRIPVTNSPDPFNPSTRIDYELQEPAAVTVRIYDIRGRLVRDLENAARSRGAHTLQWDGRNDRGVAVPSGVYVVWVQSPAASGAERLTLLR